MPTPARNQSVSFAIETTDGGLLVRFGPSLTFRETADAWPRVFKALPPEQTSGKAVVVDLRATHRLDTSGVLLLERLREHCREDGRECRFEGMSARIEQLLGPPAPAPGSKAAAAPAARAAPLAPGFLRRALGRVATILVFVGELTAAIMNACLHPTRIRWQDTLHSFQQCGAEAVPIVALICLLMGVIMAFQAAVQLHAFGADIYVADLVGLSISRELGPLMVAIICAGRSGAAFAAELGTMKVGEEIDALVTMGLDPQRFLVMPKMLGILAALPCLTILGDLIGIAGGMLIGATVLDVPYVVYLNQTLLALSYSDVFGGVVKSLVFGLLIGGIGCFCGLTAGQSAQSVGRSATSAVVAGISSIILADAAFSVMYHVLGI